MTMRLLHKCFFSKVFLLFLLYFFSTQTQAISKISLDIQKLLPFDVSSVLDPEWQLNNLTAYIEEPFTEKQQLVFEIPKITLSKLTISQKVPLDFTFKVICKQFQFSIEEIECKSGRLQLTSVQEPNLDVLSGLSFVYNLSSRQLKLKLKPLQLTKLKGEISLKHQNNIWHIGSRLHNLDITYIKKMAGIVTNRHPSIYLFSG